MTNRIMDRSSSYFKQVQLLIQLLPVVNTEAIFALKGGTAINLFVRDMPRLSVDIDLVYLPDNSRDKSIKDIHLALDRIAEEIQTRWNTYKIDKSYLNKDDALRLVVFGNGVQVKIELSPVLRGTVFEPVKINVTDAVEDEFGFAEITVVSMADLYAGKICAALDRQHPRDLFDVKLLLENQGITDEIRKAFIVYLISHPRPIAELLKPNLLPLEKLFNSEFLGMTFTEVTLEQLEMSRLQLIKELQHSLQNTEKQFLISFQNKFPDWALLGLPNIKELPAIKWKLLNLGRMSKQNHQKDTEKLENVIKSIG